MTIQTRVALEAAPETHWLDTGYRVAVTGPGPIGSFVAWVQPNAGPPLHVHYGEDEAIHVLDGAAEFWLDGAVGRLGPGEGIFLPRGIPHTFRVVSPHTARLLGVVTPGGFEGFFAAAAAAGVGPHDGAALQAFGDGWRVEFLSPSPWLARG